KSIDVFNLFKTFFSSEMPSLLTNQFGTALKLTFVEGMQVLTDKMLGVVQAFNQDFGGSVEQVGNFFSKTFSNILNLFSSDFVQALTNPIAFISGKLFSGLKDAADNGGISFKSVMTDGVETTLGKLSSGLGESAQKYSEDYKAGTERIGQEWDKITGDLESSATDFFGAEPAAQRLTDKMGEIEASGKAFREQFETSTDKPAENIKQIATDLGDASVESGDIEQRLLNAGDNLKLNTRESKENMNEIKTVGDLIAAQDAAKPMLTFKEQVTKAREELKALKDFIGEDLSKYSIPDIAKKLGIDVAGKEQRELFDEIVQRLEEIKGRQIELSINKEATKEDISEIISNIAAIGYESVEVALDANKAITNISESVGDLSETENQLNLTADNALSQISEALPEYFENPLALNLDADKSIDKIEKDLDKLEKQKVTTNLDATSSIQKIRSELSKEIDLSLSSSTGSDILKTISKAVSTIKDLVYSLEKKLPQPALGN
ncbi:MAG: hypothetical protein RIR37_110, partial [Verrucomicrobiota bacterium]